MWFTYDTLAFYSNHCKKNSYLCKMFWEKDVENAMLWFIDNCIQANPKNVKKCFPILLKFKLLYYYEANIWMNE